MWADRDGTGLLQAAQPTLPHNLQHWKATLQSCTTTFSFCSTMQQIALERCTATHKQHMSAAGCSSLICSSQWTWTSASILQWSTTVHCSAFCFYRNFLSAGPEQSRSLFWCRRRWEAGWLISHLSWHSNCTSTAVKSLRIEPFCAFKNSQSQHWCKLKSCRISCSSTHG